MRDGRPLLGKRCSCADPQGSKAGQACAGQCECQRIAAAGKAANAQQRQLLVVEKALEEKRAAAEARDSRIQLRAAECSAKEAASKAAEEARDARQRAEEAQARHSAVQALGFIF